MRFDAATSQTHKVFYQRLLKAGLLGQFKSFCNSPLIYYFYLMESFKKLEVEHLRNCEKRLSSIESETVFEKILVKSTALFQERLSRIISVLN